MGSLAKKLGQLSQKSLESESANILKTCRANKLPGSLSLELDGTLKRGHDMKAFGLGTLASMSSIDRYKRFTMSMHAVYSAMEGELDNLTENSTNGTTSPEVSSPKTTESIGLSSEPTTVAELWKKHSPVLRRSNALYQDLLDVVGPVAPTSTTPSNEENILQREQLQREQLQLILDQPATLATQSYVDAILLAGEHDRKTGGGKLTGHLYCRYFADLFGGQILKSPYNVALGLPLESPRHYAFDFSNSSSIDRRSYIESLYHDINLVREGLNEAQREDVVEEAMGAFRHNVHVYTEEPVVMDSLRGAMNMGVGFGTSFVKGFSTSART